MKFVLKLEELAMWITAIILLWALKVDWWWYLLMFIGPDVSMIGYLVNNKAGAISYNFFHHKGIALLLIISGWAFTVLDPPYTITSIGLALFGHSSMDRFFGYGLKYENGFMFTHLGEIGKTAKSE
jgi:Domain of unknown function (DUF4260)